jgi:hypothetical protein
VSLHLCFQVIDSSCSLSCQSSLLQYTILAAITFVSNSVRGLLPSGPSDGVAFKHFLFNVHAELPVCQDKMLLA